MTDNNSEVEGEIPVILQNLWRNWQQDGGGGGRCSDCPAHWSNRTDISGVPGERTSSFQHRPFCGDGSMEPDIAIIAREPGPPREDDLDKNKREKSLEDVRNKSIIKSPGGSIKHASPLFERIAHSEFAGHFTQIRKCNELRGGGNTEARRQCAGSTVDHQGYLYDEIEALDPDYVITITTGGQKEFCDVFNLPKVGTEEMASGPTKSGFQTLEQQRLDFTWVPAPHPSPRGAQYVYNNLDVDVDTEGYFDLFAKEVLTYIRNREECD